MGLELYLDLLSQPSRAVYIFAKKNGIPFQTRTVDILKGQHMSEQFSQVNCLNKVPVLKDGSFVLTESTAILIYLSSKYQVADHWYPADLQARAQVHEYLGWHADNIRGTFGVLLWTKIELFCRSARCWGHSLGSRFPRRRWNGTEIEWSWFCNSWRTSSSGTGPSLLASR
uniref:glutathione transferase n=1 Tax=Mus musculus TaxID=10090 RepID=A0A1W2P6L1_MOUSE